MRTRPSLPCLLARRCLVIPPSLTHNKNHPKDVCHYFHWQWQGRDRHRTERELDSEWERKLLRGNVHTNWLLF